MSAAKACHVRSGPLTRAARMQTRPPRRMRQACQTARPPLRSRPGRRARSSRPPGAPAPLPPSAHTHAHEQALMRAGRPMHGAPSAGSYPHQARQIAPARVRSDTWRAGFLEQGPGGRRAVAGRELDWLGVPTSWTDFRKSVLGPRSRVWRSARCGSQGAGPARGPRQLDRLPEVRAGPPQRLRDAPRLGQPGTCGR